MLPLMLDPTQNFEFSKGFHIFPSFLLLVAAMDGEPQQPDPRPIRRFIVCFKSRETRQRFLELVRILSERVFGKYPVMIQPLGCPKEVFLSLGLVCKSCVLHEKEVRLIKKIDAIFTDYIDFEVEFRALDEDKNYYTAARIELFGADEISALLGNPTSEEIATEFFERVYGIVAHYDGDDDSYGGGGDDDGMGF